MLTVGKWYQNLGDNKCIQFCHSSEPSLQSQHSRMCRKKVLHEKVLEKKYTDQEINHKEVIEAINERGL